MNGARAAGLCAALTATPLSAQGILAQLAPDAPVAAEAVGDTDGDGRAELLVFGRDGIVTRHALRAGDGTLRPTGTLRLRDPQRSLVALVDLLPAPGTEIVVCDGQGTSCVLFEGPDGEGSWVALARRARCTLPLGQPQLSPFVQDLDRDGRLDLLVPSLQGVQPFLQEAGSDAAAPTFRAMARLPVPIRIELDEIVPGRRRERQGMLEISPIETADLDGDGRPDLLTRDDLRHAFHLQDPDGGFRRPIEVDLRQFEDSTPKAPVAPGATLVLGDRQLLQRGDIDGDGIPDFVIAHRRKVWTFLSTRQGPQFTKARTQAVADDVSAMLLVDLDEDGCSDLLTFQVQVPGVGALLLGLVQSIDIDIKAVGYRSVGGALASTPAWRRTITLRIPPLLRLLSQQDELVRRFTEVVGKARLGVRGAFTAASRRDLLVVGRDGRQLELFALDGAAPTLESASGRRLLRRLLFEDPDPVFDLDRLFVLLGGFLDEQSGGAIGDRAPVHRVELRDPTVCRLVDLLVADFDGDGRAEAVAVYERVVDPATPATLLPQRVYDVLQFPPAVR